MSDMDPSIALHPPVCGELLILGKSVIRHTQGDGRSDALQSFDFRLEFRSVIGSADVAYLMKEGSDKRGIRESALQIDGPTT